MPVAMLGVNLIFCIGGRKTSECERLSHAEDIHVIRFVLVYRYDICIPVKKIQFREGSNTLKNIYFIERKRKQIPVLSEIQDISQGLGDLR